MTTWVVLAIVLVLIGLVLVLAEAFVPSGGMLTVMAVVSGGGGIALAFLKVKSPAFGVVLTACALVLAPMAFLYGLSRLPRTFIGRRIVLGRPREHGWTAGREEKDYRSLLGREGRALGPLRPAGIAEFDGRRWDVVTEGPMVAAGTRIRVIAVEANRVVVRSVEDEPEQTPGV